MSRHDTQGRTVERLAAFGIVLAAGLAAASEPSWRPLPQLPDPIGVAGAFVGNHLGAVIVAGGANYAPAGAADLWTAPKRWRTAAYVLCETDSGPAWKSGFALPRPVANGASVSIPEGVVCLGGDYGTRATNDVLLLEWNPAKGILGSRALASLPSPTTAATAAVIGDAVYVVGGQADLGLDSATAEAWRIDWKSLVAGDPAARWERLPDTPAGPRAFACATVQMVDREERLFLIGGRRMAAAGGVEPLSDLHEFSPRRHATDPATGWRRLRPAPTTVMAGTAVPLGADSLVVLTGDDGGRIAMEAADPDSVRTHPGFPRRAWAYLIPTDEWRDLGPTPANQVNAAAVAWRGGFVIASGELRPRVRTCDVWWILPPVHVAEESAR